MQDNLDTYRIINNIVNPKLVRKSEYHDVEVEGIKCRVFGTNKKRVIIYIHGGGFVSGTIDSYTNLASKLSKELDSLVFLVDYSLAPEAKFPSSYNELRRVTKSLIKTHDNIVLMGDSAGANLAFAVANKLRDKKIREIVMIYPPTQTDYTNSTKYKSVITNSGKSLLSKGTLRDYMKLYLRNEHDYKDKRVNLMRNYWLFGLPPVTIITGSLDPLHDEGLALRNKLEKYLVNVRYLDLEGAIHGFMTNPLEHKYTNMTINFIKESDTFE